MKCRVEKSRISGEVACPPNKSYTHRAVFLAALSTGQSTVRNALRSADTDATVSACRALGAEIGWDGGTVTVSRPATLEGTGPIDAKNSATTIRIAAGIAALSASRTTLTGDESLQKRPMRPILDALEALGATCTSTDGRPPVTVQGRIRGGSVTVPGDVSSQFVSSLLICAPLTERGVTVGIDGELVSKPYLEATIASMQKFGVRVETDQTYKRYTVRPQRYRETSFTVPSDYSSLALLLSAAVLVGGERVAIRTPDSDGLPQGDRAFLGILRDLGVQVKTDVGGGGGLITAKSPERLGGGSFDLSDTPDLLPPLAIMALKCQNPLEITNVRHARYKETDRIATVCRELAKLGVRADERRDGMRLETAGGGLRGASLDSGGDHRLFMAFSIAGMYVGDCSVSDPDSVSVSYPDFVPEMQRMGARLSVQAQNP